MKGAKYILTVAVIAMSSVMMTGCFKPSKDAVVESKYYQSLKDERDKLSVQLKEEKKKTNSLNKKIKAIQWNIFYYIQIHKVALIKFYESIIQLPCHNDQSSAIYFHLFVLQL